MDSVRSAGVFLRRHFRHAKEFLFQALLFSGYIAFIELFFHVTEKLEFSARFLYPILFSLPLGFFFTSIFALFRPKINCILSTVTAGLAGVWFLVQIVYSSVFQTYMEFNKISMGGDVVAGFGNEMFEAIIDNIPKILAVALVTAVFSLVLFRYLHPRRQSIFVAGAGLIACLLLHFFCRGMLLIGGTGDYSPSIFSVPVYWITTLKISAL